MATVTSVTADPTTVSPGGGTSTITPTIVSNAGTATVTVSVDGSSGTAPITLQENLTYSVDPADEGKTGVVVATVDQGGTLASNGDGTFTFTAS